MSWTYTGNDPGLALFTACLRAGAPMPIAPLPRPFGQNMRVLEIGCNEADWLHLAGEAWPDAWFVGIDTRAPHANERDGRLLRCNANALDRSIYPAESFDAVVSLSALEHMGLGHYGDPKDPDGDTVAFGNILHWLKPDGWLYFDVPYDPTGYRVQGTECRVYDEAAIASRLWREGFVRRWERCAPARDAGTLCAENPTAAVEPFYYRAMVWEKTC